MTAPPSGPPTPDQLRQMNRQMAGRILQGDPDPYVDGDYAHRVLEVRRRRSGDVVQVPIAVVSRDGGHYLVSPVRTRNWVRNLLADPACVIASRDERGSHHAVPVDDPATVADVVSTYLARMRVPWAIAAFPFPADAERGVIEASASRLAVFRLDPADPADPSPGR